MAWQRIRGHDAVMERFTRSWRRGRLAHGYLFAGPSGVGKRLFAGELAKALLCEAPPAGRLEACDHCVACTLVDAGTHPDLFAVGRPPESNEIPIEIMRELCRGFGLKSARGRGKVAILDDADDLNEASANCFLKTLEEPPPRSVFILVGTSMDRQLATIVSRCQVVRFVPLPGDVVADLLKAQGVEDAKQAQRLARLAGGSPGQALALADPALWQFRKVLLEGLSGPRADTVGLARAWIEFIEEAGKETAAQRRRAALVLRLLMEFLKDALGVALGAPPRFAESEDQRLAQNLLRQYPPDQILALLERCLEAETQLDRYVQIALVLEGLLDAAGQLAPAAK
jgi:DNA polymerase III subunit delta'